MQYSKEKENTQINVYRIHSLHTDKHAVKAPHTVGVRK